MWNSDVTTGRCITLYREKQVCTSGSSESKGGTAQHQSCLPEIKILNPAPPPQDRLRHWRAVKHSWVKELPFSPVWPRLSNTGSHTTITSVGHLWFLCRHPSTRHVSRHKKKKELIIQLWSYDTRVTRMLTNGGTSESLEEAFWILFPRWSKPPFAISSIVFKLDGYWWQILCWAKICYDHSTKVWNDGMLIQ